MGFFDRLFGRKPQQKPIPMKGTEEEYEQKPTPTPANPETIDTDEAAVSAEALQRKLDRYFARLREIYPDGVISGLNTEHKKLAERGAQLRHLTGETGDLDAFFARGGFTYQRRTGGRPSLAISDASVLEARVRALFPQGAPTAMALRDNDHRLYLDLRAIARRENTTVSAWLAAHGLTAKTVDVT